MRILLLFLSLHLTIQVSFAQNWKVNNSLSKVGFKIKNAGLSVEGEFTGFEAEINFDKDNLSASRIKSTILTSTLNSGIKLRDRHLSGEEYFNTSQYPNIFFTSKKIIPLGNGAFSVTGDLKIKNKIKEVSIPFTFTENENNGIFNGSLKINRRDFAVGGSSWTMSDEVDIILKIHCLKK